MDTLKSVAGEDKDVAGYIETMEYNTMHCA